MGPDAFPVHGEEREGGGHRDSFVAIHEGMVSGEVDHQDCRKVVEVPAGVMPMISGGHDGRHQPSHVPDPARSSVSAYGFFMKVSDLSRLEKERLLHLFRQSPQQIVIVLEDVGLGRLKIADLP